MYTMKINSGCKNVGVVSQAHGSQITAIRSAPEPDPLGINRWLTLQESGTSHHIPIFGPSPPARIGSLTESAAIHNSQTIIYREYNVALAREVLVHGIRIV